MSPSSTISPFSLSSKLSWRHLPGVCFPRPAWIMITTRTFYFLYRISLCNYFHAFLVSEDRRVNKKTGTLPKVWPTNSRQLKTMSNFTGKPQHGKYLTRALLNFSTVWNTLLLTQLLLCNLSILCALMFKTLSLVWLITVAAKKIN